jgi:hypothetical protein
MKKLILLLTQLFCHHKYQYTEINHDGLNTMECKWCGKRKIVKILPLFILAIVVCGCNTHPHITDYGVVEQIELYENIKVSTNYTTKYRVRISKDFNAHWISTVYLYTNDLYQIGDTVYVTKKN